FFPSCMATAFKFTGFGAAAYQTMLDQVLQEAGSLDDPVAVMLAQQLVFVHLRIAQLQASAAEAKGTEAIKIVNAAAERIGEVGGESRRGHRQPVCYRASNGQTLNVLGAAGLLGPQGSRRPALVRRPRVGYQTKLREAWLDLRSLVPLGTPSAIPRPV